MYCISNKEDLQNKGGEHMTWENYNETFYKCPECGYLLGKDCPSCGNRVELPSFNSGEYMTEDEKRLLLLVAKNLIHSNNASVRAFLNYDDKKAIENLIEKLDKE